MSSTSAQRFAARVRRRRRQRAVVTGSAMTLGLLVGWLLFGSGTLAVQRIEVRGAQRVSAGDVRAAVRFELGHPMALIAPGAAARAAAAVPLVRSATVVRSWPSTLIVVVHERQPIAAVPAGAGGLALLDEDGVVVGTTAHAPVGLPVLDVDVGRAGAASLRAARRVSDDLPAALRRMVRRITAATPDAIGLVLTDGSTVNWGSADDGPGKAEALLALHPRPVEEAVTIDVSAPDSPAITRPTR
ncbi:MAG TPA: FtsQ-type POTRA domain-containing protein [Kineosporiaceae bacterium]